MKLTMSVLIFCSMFEIMFMLQLNKISKLRVKKKLPKLNIPVQQIIVPIPIRFGYGVPGYRSRIANAGYGCYDGYGGGLGIGGFGGGFY